MRCRTSLWAAYALFIMICGTAEQARADDICRDETAADMAVKKGVEAKKLQEGGDFAKALALLEEAWSLCPHPRLLFLKARSLMALQRYAEAREIYRLIETSLQHFPQPERVAEIKEGLRICEEQLHQAEVTFDAGQLDGVSLTLDGVAMGILPLTAKVGRGKHTAVAHKVGYEQGKLDFVVELEPQIELTLVLVPEPGSAVADPLLTDIQTGEPNPGWKWAALGGGVAFLGGSAGFWGNYAMQNSKDLAPNQRAEGGAWDIALGSMFAGVGVGLVTTAVWLWVTEEEYEVGP